MYDRDNNYAFLPKKFRDFHQQKDLFKDIYKVVDYDNRDIDQSYKINWIQMHTNVVDVFLFQMAKRGYVLKKDTRFMEDEVEEEQQDEELPF